MGVGSTKLITGSDEIMEKNWEGALESVMGRLERWKWLLSKMSYKGRMLIINDLVSLSLWHKLACIDPPPDLCHKLTMAVVVKRGDAHN